MDSTVAGAAIGAGAVLASFAMQEVAVALRERRKDRRESEGQRRIRERNAAAVSDRLFLELGSTMPKKLRADRSRSVSDQTQQDLATQVEQAFEKIEVAAFDLPALVRDRVEHGLDLIRNADRLAGDLGGDVHHYHSPMQIARNISLEMHGLLTSYLRGETLPEPSQHMIEYHAAGRSLDEELQWEFAQEIGEAEHARAEWLEKRPEVKAQLDHRRQPPN